MLRVIKENKDILRIPKGWSVVYLTFPLSFPLAKKLFKTKISPNQVTFFSGLIAIGAGYLFFKGGQFCLLLGGLIFYFSFVLDQADGNLARLKNQSSEFGRKFDLVMDSFRKIICFIPLLYSQFYFKGGIKMLQLGLILVFLHYGMHFVFNLLKHRKFQLTAFGKWLLTKGVAPRPFGKTEEQFLIFIIGPLLNQFIIIFCISLGLFFFLALLVKIKIVLFGGKGW